MDQNITIWKKIKLAIVASISFIVINIIVYIPALFVIFSAEDSMVPLYQPILAFAFSFIFATISTYLVISLLIQRISKYDWQITKKIFISYLGFVVLGAVVILMNWWATLGQAIGLWLFVFPWHSALSVLLLDIFTNTGFISTDIESQYKIIVGVFISIFSLSIIYYLLRKKFKTS